MVQKLNIRCITFHKSEMESVLEADADTVFDHIRETLEMVEDDDFMVTITKCEHLMPIGPSEDELDEKKEVKDED